MAPLIATKSSTDAMIVDARSVTIVGRDAGPRIRRATAVTQPDPVKRFHHKRLPSQPPPSKITHVLSAEQRGRRVMIGTLFTEVQRGFAEAVGIHTIIIGGPVTILSPLGM